MPLTTLVLTVLGDDRAGLVSAVSAPLKAHGASWERSQMARLAGRFAGIVEVSVDSSAVDALSLDLRALADQGLSVHVETGDTSAAEAAAEAQSASRLSLDLIGADRPGILADISALVADAGVSIEELSTQVREAPMAGGLLFEAHAVLVAPAETDSAALRNALEQLADELMVELALAVDES